MQTVNLLIVMLKNFNRSTTKKWIVNQGNKLAADSPLMTKEVLSVTAMKGNDFVTDLTDADHILSTTQIRQKTSLQFHRKNLKLNK